MKMKLSRIDWHKQGNCWTWWQVRKIASGAGKVTALKRKQTPAPA